MSKVNNFAAPEDVEKTFYEAIARGDADQMISLWAEDEETLCVHPTGIRLLGIPAIRESWRGIFSTAKIRIQAEMIAHWHSSILAIHHLTETLFVGNDPSPHGPLHVSHVYTRGPHGWRLACRHASAADEGHQEQAEATVSHTLH